MSMPTFPEQGTNITQEQAFNMLLASIAMEELALSHILNAEGEKLQYILGTLPRSPCPCATPKELLEVNRSVSNLLENVMHNQLLLKGKLDRVLDARERWEPCQPQPCPKGYCSAQATCNTVWDACTHLPLKISRCANCLCWQNCAPTLLYLASCQRYLLSFSFRLQAQQAGAVSLSLQRLEGNVWRNVLTTDGYACAPHATVHICGNTVLCPENCPQTHCPIAFVLHSPTSLVVEQGSINLVAL